MVLERGPVVIGRYAEPHQYMANLLIVLSLTLAHSTNLVTLDHKNHDGRTHGHGGCGQHVASASWKSLLGPLNGGIDDH